MKRELKEQAHKEFDEKFDSTKTVGSNHFSISTANELKSFIDSLIDKTVQMTEERIVEELALLRLAYEELLELRGFLTQAGEYDPNYDRLEEYWKIGKPEWEKKLNNITK